MTVQCDVMMMMDFRDNNITPYKTYGIRFFLLKKLDLSLHGGVAIYLCNVVYIICRYNNSDELVTMSHRNETEQCMIWLCILPATTIDFMCRRLTE